MVVFRAALAFLLMTSPASAAPLRILVPGIAAACMKALGEAYTKRTGVAVIVSNGTAGTVRDKVLAGGMGDVVVEPAEIMLALAAAQKFSQDIAVGQTPFAVVVKAGAPHPDISTLAKFHAALSAAGSIGFTDPASGSLSGTMITAMLAQPGFEGVAPRPLKGNPPSIAASGMVPMAGGTVAEEINVPGTEIIGTFPDSLGMKIKLRAAVLSDAAMPTEAKDFLQFIASPQATAIWANWGITPPTTDHPPQ